MFESWPRNPLWQNLKFQKTHGTHTHSHTPLPLNDFSDYIHFRLNIVSVCVVLRWIAVIRAWKRIIIFTCTHKLTTIKPKSCPNWAVMWKINLWPFICVDEKSNRNSCAFPKNDYKFKQCFVQQYKILKLLNITTFTHPTAVHTVYAVHRQTVGISSMAENGILCVSTSCTTSKNGGKRKKKWRSGW